MLALSNERVEKSQVAAFCYPPKRMRHGSK
jgi:hypothetical protein